MANCTRFYWLGLIALLSGCAGVPQLYKPSRVNADTALAPKVEHIVDRITCEIAGVSKSHLAGKEYIVTVVLTLQVNDELNFTPSLSFIDVLTTPGTNRTVTQNMGVGGSRERLFTSTFVYNSKDLADQKVEGCARDPQKLYRLDGDLGIAEIVRDGMGIGGRQQLLGHGPPPATPSFASQIKFVVTRSVGALGPTWTLVSFKGPGGANGLFNGKALTTDTVSIAFAEKKKAPPSLATEAQLAELIALVSERAKRQREAAEEVEQRRKSLQATIQNEAQKNSGLRPQSAQERERGKAMIASAEQALRDAERAREQAAEELARAIDAREAADAAYAVAERARSQDEAIATGQNLITTMILQTLNVQPR